MLIDIITFYRISLALSFSSSSCRCLDYVVGFLCGFSVFFFAGRIFSSLEDLTRFQIGSRSVVFEVKWTGVWPMRSKSA